MCCVGTKLVMRDYYYLINCFQKQEALTPETACSFRDLAVDTLDHMFARDNFQSLLRGGHIQRNDQGLYYLADQQCLANFACKFGA